MLLVSNPRSILGGKQAHSPGDNNTECRTEYGTLGGEYTDLQGLLTMLLEVN